MPDAWPSFADHDDSCCGGRSGGSSSSSSRGPLEVHTLWVGTELPEWVPLCIKSYLQTGHHVNFWIYDRERQSDFLALPGLQLLREKGLRIRDLEEIAPLRLARRLYFHGMGAEGKWRGWAPLSDWLRYEIMARFGGWWVDADSVSVRSLQGLAGSRPAAAGAAEEETLVLCTERHRMNRCTLGAVAVQDTAEVHSAASLGKRQVLLMPDIRGVAPTLRRKAFSTWAADVKSHGENVGLLTNNHFYVGRAGRAVMLKMAQQMKRLLLQYAEKVDRLGVAAVQQRCEGGGGDYKTMKSGNTGMSVFQQTIRQLLYPSSAKSTGISGSWRVRILHWSAFNGVDATEAERMHRVLDGREAVRDHRVLSLHIFRQVRDVWTRMGRKMPCMVPAVATGAQVGSSSVTSVNGHADLCGRKRISSSLMEQAAKRARHFSKNLARPATSPSYDLTRQTLTAAPIVVVADDPGQPSRTRQGQLPQKLPRQTSPRPLPLAELRQRCAQPSFAQMQLPKARAPAEAPRAEASLQRLVQQQQHFQQKASKTEKATLRELAKARVQQLQAFLRPAPQPVAKSEVLADMDEVLRAIDETELLSSAVQESGATSKAGASESDQKDLQRSRVEDLLLVSATPTGGAHGSPVSFADKWPLIPSTSGKLQLLQSLQLSASFDTELEHLVASGGVPLIVNWIQDVEKEPDIAPQQLRAAHVAVVKILHQNKALKALNKVQKRRALAIINALKKPSA
eukprot:TRINITY_DN81399_c0_g1_i1.p1 TRINITY_DN81399_c0_g1~~TRINITY_DN81399_c0_g1_i1.p1  ORF type:complete len:737 (-),score=173.60 TRINITY_DN81399_c0_g1_i1:92-2302(-)